MEFQKTTSTHRPNPAYIILEDDNKFRIPPERNSEIDRRQQSLLYMLARGIEIDQVPKSLQYPTSTSRSRGRRVSGILSSAQLVQDLHEI
jgi:hypothetical protein